MDRRWQRGTRNLYYVLRLSVIGTLALVVRPGPALAAPSPSVVTADGAVVGLRDGPVDVFFAIPYAAPPVGPLRFLPPQPHAAWTAPLQATQPAPVCPQIPLSTGVLTGSEDCLYLNVWTPKANDRARRPVMLFIHGGGNRGAGSEPYYYGENIARQAGVVVVTIDYRIGPLGFLTASALDRESGSGVSGNYGILDQQAALRWVRRNIAAFGGNPGNVTVFGESFGAISTEVQLVSPAARGLFTHVIIESSANVLPTLAATETGTSAATIAAVGCAGASDVAACLRAVPAASFVVAGGSANPVVDGQVIPLPILQAFQTGQFTHVPLIFGNNHDEETVFVGLQEAASGPVTAASYAAQLQSIYGADAGAILAHYPVASYQSPAQALAAAETDGIFSCLADQKRTALERYVPVFGYEFNEPGPAQGPIFSSPQPGLTLNDYHTSELPYVFGLSSPDGVPVTGKDLALSQRIITYWTDFATVGAPVLPVFQLPIWFDLRLTHLLVSLRNGGGYLTEDQFRSEHQCGFWEGLQIPL